jgi:hypothetical protein
LLDADSVIRERIRGVEVECEQKTTTFKDDDLVILILERDVSLWGNKVELAF